MEQSHVLRSALNVIQGTGMTAAELARQTGLSSTTCRKLLKDTAGQKRYLWSTITFALSRSGGKIVVVTENRSLEQPKIEVGYRSRRLARRSNR